MFDATAALTTAGTISLAVLYFRSITAKIDTVNAQLDSLDANTHAILAALEELKEAILEHIPKFCALVVDSFAVDNYGGYAAAEKYFETYKALYDADMVLLPLSRPPIPPCRARLRSIDVANLKIFYHSTYPAHTHKTRFTWTFYIGVCGQGPESIKQNWARRASPSSFYRVACAHHNATFKGAIHLP
ncbi:hypothetical protein B0H17DRAFT_1335066 [Mycena rosella]|uniref:Uncharacterized protein n=1 Tax=Mycena rosella TaxID=1033263 RepID=A0AAD7GBG0_MYCRO|nr:hypothetical protein B0H17DRAFT_1335066 [Mycena rosella]